jgi:hypothetical protein
MLALLACLWLLIPGLCKSLKNVQEPSLTLFSSTVNYSNVSLLT